MLLFYGFALTFYGFALIFYREEILLYLDSRRANNIIKYKRLINLTKQNNFK